MARYVLLRRQGCPDPAELDRIAAVPGVTIVDRAVSRALLIDASAQSAALLRSQLKDWIVAEEVEYPRPAPARHEIRGEEQ